MDFILGGEAVLLYLNQADFSVMTSYYVTLPRVESAVLLRFIHAGASARTKSELPAKVKPRSEVSDEVDVYKCIHASECSFLVLLYSHPPLLPS